jgi:hypothetical protein
MIISPNVKATTFLYFEVQCHVGQNISDLSDVIILQWLIVSLDSFMRESSFIGDTKKETAFCNSAFHQGNVPCYAWLK